MPSFGSPAKSSVKSVLAAKLWFDAVIPPIVTVSVNSGPQVLLWSASGQALESDEVGTRSCWASTGDVDLLLKACSGRAFVGIEPFLLGAG